MMKREQPGTGSWQNEEGKGNIMKKSREESGRLHKERCKELKQLRAMMAADLGINLEQSECTFEGYCSGTCPKCRQEELRINAALLKRQVEESNLKRKVTTAGLATAAALCLTGCDTTEPKRADTQKYEKMAGDIVELFTGWKEETEPSTEELEGYYEELEGVAPPSYEEWEGGFEYQELEGDVAWE